MDLGDPFPKGGLKVTVPAGATQLAAALRGFEGDVPAGVIVTVTQPDGTVLDQPTEPWDPNLVVQIKDNSLVGLLVREPQQGDWTIQVVSANPDAEYIFGFSTIPTKDVRQTVDQTLSKMLPPGAREQIEAALDDSWGCFWCKVGCYALAVVITALVAAGLVYVTAGAAPIIALGVWLGIQATAAAALVTGAVAAGALTLDIVISYICEWSGACKKAEAEAIA